MGFLQMFYISRNRSELKVRPKLKEVQLEVVQLNGQTEKAMWSNWKWSKLLLLLPLLLLLLLLPLHLLDLLLLLLMLLLLHLPEEGLHFERHASSWSNSPQPGHHRGGEGEGGQKGGL
jgi:hypothetical protein